MLGIIGAMDIEVDMLKSMLSDTQSEKISGVDFVKGKLHGKDVVVARCGIGKVNAAICAQSMILKYAPDTIINIGVGGSLSNILDIGDVAIADFVVQSDADTSPLGDPVGLISTINIIKIPCSQKVASLLSKCADNLGVRTLKGTISTSDAFIANSEKKDWLVSNFDAIACEMEGGSIGHVCYVNGVDFGVLRAVSDKADGTSHMDYGQFCAMAAKNSTALICEYIKNL
ncbi:MAG: 5'-methylthioadenosine/adenosylhomocysteine nucleosidase [Ruminococcaceae bacterium]|nr:5'-methylthioadenosine/adenosylhomocysteine nucleosidase [Oscillospiraceae bacterium]